MMGGYMHGNALWAGHWLWLLVMAVLVIVPVWRICQRAGYPGWLSMFIVIPMLNLVFLYFIAFSDWPANQETPPEE